MTKTIRLYQPPSNCPTTPHRARLFQEGFLDAAEGLRSSPIGELFYDYVDGYQAGKSAEVPRG